MQRFVKSQKTALDLRSIKFSQEIIFKHSSSFSSWSEYTGILFILLLSLTSLVFSILYIYCGKQKYFTKGKLKNICVVGPRKIFYLIAAESCGLVLLGRCCISVTVLRGGSDVMIGIVSCTVWFVGMFPYCTTSLLVGHILMEPQIGKENIRDLENTLDLTENFNIYQFVSVSLPNDTYYWN